MLKKLANPHAPVKEGIGSKLKVETNPLKETSNKYRRKLVIINLTKITSHILDKEVNPISTINN